jgi:hypothetical protein
VDSETFSYAKWNSNYKKRFVLRGSSLIKPSPHISIWKSFCVPIHLLYMPQSKTFDRKQKNGWGGGGGACNTRLSYEVLFETRQMHIWVTVSESSQWAHIILCQPVAKNILLNYDQCILPIRPSFVRKANGLPYSELNYKTQFSRYSEHAMSRTIEEYGWIFSRDN